MYNIIHRFKQKIKEIQKYLLKSDKNKILILKRIFFEMRKTRKFLLYFVNFYVIIQVSKLPHKFICTAYKTAKTEDI